MSLSRADQALLQLLQALEARGYSFTTPTPLTHARVVARVDRQQARSLRDIFGWSLPFAVTDIEPELHELLERADALQPAGSLYRSRWRVSQLHGRLFLHSAYPTTASDAVFFGPDTYRFADFILAEMRQSPAGLRCIDLGAGSGAGAIVAAARSSASSWTLADINPAALRLSGINALHVGQPVECVLSDLMLGVQGNFDLIVSNPPYVADLQGRAYRDGGNDLGRALSLRIVRESLDRLNSGGQLLLYTGIAMIDGVDPFLLELNSLLDGRDCAWRYRELDPDVFGEELEQPAYAQAERIAAVGLSLRVGSGVRPIRD